MFYIESNAEHARYYYDIHPALQYADSLATEFGAGHIYEQGAFYYVTTYLSHNKPMQSIYRRKNVVPMLAPYEA